MPTTNSIDSQELPLTPGTSGNILISNGTDYDNSTATYPALAGANGTLLQSNATGFINTTAAYPATSGSTGTLLTSNGTNIVNTTAAYPSVAGASATLLTSNGTNIVNTTAAYPSSTTANQILFSSSNNVVSQIENQPNGVLVTSAGTVPSIQPTLPSAVQGNITSVGTVTSGTWNAGVIPGQFGGTGVANTGRTITIGGNLTTTGAFNTTFVVTGTNTYTYPNVAAANVCLNRGGGASNGTPKFFVFRNAFQALTANVSTKLQFNIELFDTNNYFDNVTNFRYTPLIAGFYNVTAVAGINFAGDANTVVTLSIAKNGVLYSQFASNAINNATQTPVYNINTCVQMNGTTDFLEVFILHTSSTGQKSSTGSQATLNFSGSLIV